MAKKTSRHIPTMMVNVVGGGRPDIDSLCTNEAFMFAVYKEAVEGIKDAIINKRKTAILFELDKSEYFIELDKTQWVPALQTCLDRMVDKEDYLECKHIKEVMDKIK